MKKIFFLLATTMFLLTGCEQYGKKIKINDSLEIYVKPDATEAEGKKLGDYLADLWKDAANMKSLQLSKESGTYIVRMVVDEKLVKENPVYETAFPEVKKLLEADVFNGSKIKFITTTDTFKDLKTY